ncbi:arsenate reductase (thioredoxin) [Lentibacillus sp. CBA3610]|uniref:arsenate reductase (thioredoxin) n=1 Tax=Lentibacillus sp. CBA3610 TaxID=2518176 RepID=UPI0015953723|nr:arsenate reductase (thioredoxin) [Lentibacillus sp. CBA3610]QKY71409.1 arsenate reductase (thioredoxin) [Lentibacillus sp. CBA3610]
MSQKKIYFLCTGNSCRSQMAEGWAKKYLGDKWEIRSAGIEAHGLNPNAVKAMNEVGIDISDQNQKKLNTAFLEKMQRWAVNLCADAEHRCPMTPPYVRREHWGFDDPAKAEGTEEEVWEVFQRVRDDIGERIKRFAETESCGR